jgi:hypothetical protein
LVVTSLSIAEYSVDCGVLPAGDFQYPFAAIAAINSWQVIDVPVSARTLAAASKALSFCTSPSFATFFAFRRLAGFVVVAVASGCSPVCSGVSCSC